MFNAIRITLFTVLLTVVCDVLAKEYASREEAKAMAIDAAALIEEIGMKAASAQFHDTSSRWFDRDLYVFAYDNEGNSLVFGGKPVMIGKNFWNFRDLDGDYLVRNMLAFTPGESGWIEYKMQNNVTKRIDRKASFIVRKPGYFVGVGYHLDDIYRASSDD